MSGRGSGSPLRRPETARRRRDAAADVPVPSGDELAAVERQLAELPRFSGAEVVEDAELRALLVRARERGPGVNFVACPRWSGEELGARLAVIDARMRADGQWPALMVADGVSQPTDLADRLAGAGWVAVERERVMWTRRPPAVPHLDPSTRLEAVTRRTVDEYEHLERQIFGLAEALASERAEGLMVAVEHGEIRAFLVRLHGEAVAIARVVLGERVNGIYGVGVATARRRQGYGALVTAIATRSALATGTGLAWLSVRETNEPAVRLYRVLGYQPTFTWARWLAPPL